MLTHGELTADCRSARFTFPYSMSNLWCRPLIAGRTEHEQTELRYQFRCSDSVIFQDRTALVIAIKDIIIEFAMRLVSRFLQCYKGKRL